MVALLKRRHRSSSAVRFMSRPAGSHEWDLSQHGQKLVWHGQVRFGPLPACHVLWQADDIDGVVFRGRLRPIQIAELGPRPVPQRVQNPPARDSIDGDGTHALE
jgi:hypothetical protein